MVMLMSKETYYEDSDATFKYVAYGKELELHCEVFHWSPSVLKKAYRVLGDFMNHMRKQGFEKMFTITSNPDFAKLFGGTTVANIKKDNKEYEVVVWDLK